MIIFWHASRQTGLSVLPTSQPVVRTSQPVIRTSQPGVRTSQPVVRTSQPVVRTSQPVVRTSQPGVRTSQPVVRTSQPVVRTSQPVVRTSQPVVRTSQPYVWINPSTNSSKDPRIKKQPTTTEQLSHQSSQNLPLQQSESNIPKQLNVWSRLGPKKKAADENWTPENEESNKQDDDDVDEGVFEGVNIIRGQLNSRCSP